MKLFLIFVVAFLHSQLFAATTLGGNVTLGGNATISYQGWYVDSVAGNDANSGRHPLMALKTLATLQTNNLVGATVYLKRTPGSEVSSGAVPFRESLFVSNFTVLAYGTGYKPVISGADLFTNANWTLTAGKTNTYQQAYFPPKFYFTNSVVGYQVSISNLMMCWENSKRMGVRWPGNTYGAGVITNAAQLDANWGNFYYDPAGTVYLSPSTQSSPVTNGNVYEGSVREIALWGWDKFFIQDICAEKTYTPDTAGGGYPIWGEISGTFNRCIARHGYNHLAGVANGIYTPSLAFSNSYFLDGEMIAGQAGGTLFVGFKSALNPPANIFVYNCTTEQTNLDTINSPEGFFSHDSIPSRVGGVPSVKTFIRDSYSIGCGYGFDCSQLLQAPTNCTGINNGVAGISGGQTNFGVFWVENFKAYNCKYGVQNFTDGAVVNNGLFWDALNAFNGFSTTCFATNNFIGELTNTSASGMATAAGAATNLFTSVSNTFYRINVAFVGGNQSSNTVQFSDYNDFYQVTTIGQDSGGTYTTLANWTAKYPSFDAHSIQTVPATVPSSYWPTNYARAVCADGPMILIDPVSQTIVQNNVLTVSALGAGIDTLYYQWSHAGTNLPGATATSYTVSNATNGVDDGTYTCIITNDIWSVTSGVATITITVPVTFVSLATNITGYPAQALYWVPLTGLSTNAGVVTLTDLYTNGWDLKNNAASTTWPAAVAAGASGTNTILFNGSKYLVSSVYTSSVPQEIMFIADYTNGAGNQFLFDSTGTTFRHFAAIVGGLFRCSAGNSFPDGALLEKKRCVFDLVFNPASGTSTLYTNGVLSTSGTGDGTSTMSGLTLGAKWDLSSGIIMNFVGLAAWNTNLGPSAFSAPRSNAFWWFTNTAKMSVP